MISTLRPRQAADALGMAISTFWLKAKTDPSFPKLIRLSKSMTVVREADLVAYIEKKANDPYVPRPPRPRKVKPNQIDSAN